MAQGTMTNRESRRFEAQREPRTMTRSLIFNVRAFLCGIVEFDQTTGPLQVFFGIKKATT